MRYFTDNPFERLMMEKPCGHSRAAEAAWKREEQRQRNREKQGAAEKNAAPFVCPAKEEKNMNSTANKKFYRDSDNKFIGGVCSGLAIYFNIDTMLIRIIFLVFLLAGTAGFWAYLILWFVAPLAKTSAQKCELRGLPVTAENMAKYPSSK